MTSGINGVVTKPIVPEQLERALQDIIPLAHIASTSPASPLGDPPFSQLQALTHTLWHAVISQHSSKEGAPHLASTSGVDVADIYHRSGDSMRRTKLILSAFLDSYQGLISKLKSSAHDLSPQELIIPTHSIKGLLLDIGATEAARLAATMENALKSGDVETALDVRDNLTIYTDAVAHLVERLVSDFPISDHH